MKTLKLTIETNHNFLIGAISPMLNEALANGNNDLNVTFEKVKEGIKKLQPTDLKCGRGGSHIWVSLPNNRRIAIIN